LRIDHVFLNPLVSVTGITVPRSELATVASDHLPLIADLEISAEIESSAATANVRA
jgi:endonuclease/exonuclease/phosphatase family metal-dependent hydrolase